MGQPLTPPYYAVIFTSKRSDDLSGYSDTAKQMEDLCKAQPGFLKIVHAIRDTGESVTTCYWKDQASIANWKDKSAHRSAQEQGIQKWYDGYHIEIARVERAYRWERAK